MIQIEQKPLSPKRAGFAEALRSMKPGSRDCFAVDTKGRATTVRVMAMRLKIKVTQRTIGDKIFTWRLT